MQILAGHLEFHRFLAEQLATVHTDLSDATSTE